MTIAERCTSCADFEFCQRAYGKYFLARAQGWRPEWDPKDGDRPVEGCRHWSRKTGDGMETHVGG